jgi:PAS domain S-box-containing protein
MATYEDLTKEQLINDLIKLSQRINELEKLKHQHEKTFEELVKTKAMYHGLFEFAPDAIVVVNSDGEIVQVNAQAERLFGYGRDEVLGKPVEILMPERFRQRHIEHRKGYRNEPRVRPMGTGLELYGRRKDGSEFSLDISLGPLEIEKDFFVVSVVRDISSRKQMQEELQKSRDELEIRVQERTSELAKANETLRDLSARLLSAQEEERKRIARELHDTIGSCLNGIKFRVEMALQQLGKTADIAAESLSAIIPVIQEGIEECRRMQQDLRPSMLDDLGLLTTLSWFCRRHQTIYTGTKVELEQALEERDIPDSLKVVIFRVTQEGMNNIAKHSQANLVHLSLRKMDGRIELVLEDNGQGFDLKKVFASESTKRGLGLTSMRERTELSGGSFVIKSAEGKGTTIRVSWPAGPEYS